MECDVLYQITVYPFIMRTHTDGHYSTALQCLSLNRNSFLSVNNKYELFMTLFLKRKKVDVFKVY
jgi:hypothetical protein